MDTYTHSLFLATCRRPYFVNVPALLQRSVLLSDRTVVGRAIGTVLRLSSVVCNVKYCG